MELTELEIFRAVAREQSVTRAAKRLDRVQSNVTTRVRQLEDDLGVALFMRDSKRMTLTPEGERFLPYAERILALSEEARQAMRSDVPSGSLRLGSMEAAAASRLPVPLTRFHEGWPEVQVEIQTGTTQALVDAVTGHRIDCALVAHPDAGSPKRIDIGQLGPGLQGRFVCTEQLMLLAPPGHPAVRRPADVRVRNIAAFARGCTYRRCLEEWLARDEGDPGRWNIIELASYDAMMAHVMAGTAIAVMPQSVVDMQRAGPQPNATLLRPVHTFLVSRTGFDTAAFQAFAEELSRAVA
jgi:DNA-binding transcriptional LysR family regulator